MHRGHPNTTGGLLRNQTQHQLHLSPKGLQEQKPDELPLITTNSIPGHQFSKTVSTDRHRDSVHEIGVTVKETEQLDTGLGKPPIAERGAGEEGQRMARDPNCGERVNSSVFT